MVDLSNPAKGLAGDDAKQTTYVKQRPRDGRKEVSYPPLPDALSVPVYDNHAHLDIADADESLSLAEQLDRASAVGVVGVIQSSGDIASSRYAVAAAEADRRVLASVAIHPNDAPVYAEAGELAEAIAIIDELAAHPRVRAVGETGLDFFRTGESGHPAQFESFEAHIDIAKRRGLAMQIHDRDAHDAVLATLRRVGAPDRTVFHCFSGDAEFARAALDLGCYLSFAGNITFKNAQNLRDALAVAPRDRILVETDAPFLTPVPFRGRSNAPYLVPITMRFMAETLATDLDDLCADVAANTLRVYGEF